MSHDERRKWDERFRSGDQASTEPDPFLDTFDQYRSLLPEHTRALDVACGGGRNSVWLAKKEWAVTGCDVSVEGLRIARGLASERGVAVDLVCMDLENAIAFRTKPLGDFDLIVCFFYLERSLFPFLKAALKPGGVIVYKTFMLDSNPAAGGPKHSTYLLKPQELLRSFEDFRVVYYQEVVGERGTAQIIAQKEGAQKQGARRG